MSSEEEMIKVIMRQTDYDEMKARDALERNKTLEKTIEEFLGVVSTKEQKPSSTNQAIYKSIRDWLS